MSLLATILEALAPLFLLILLGNLLKRYSTILHVQHVPIINGIVINVTLPALILISLLKAPALQASYARLPLCAFCAEMATMAFVFALTCLLPRLPRGTRGMLMIMSSFGNTAFLGYPITLSLLPKVFPAAILIDQFGMTMIAFISVAIVGSIYGSTADGSSRWSAITSRIVRNTLLWAALAGLLLHLIPWPSILTEAPASAALGKVLMQSLTLLGQATTPIILIALGASLQPRAAAASSKLILLPCVFKLIVCPVFMWVFCRWFGFSGDLLRVGVLEASMPSSVIVSVLCDRAGLDGPLARGVVFAATACSILTIPLLQWLLRG